jgi:branched-chain amino acid transport system permease protein
MFWQQIVNGLTVGSTYSLIALGYTLIFGVLGILNMAHGEVFMFGAFIGLLTVTQLGLPLPVAFLAALAASAFLGLVLEMVALRPLRRRAVSHLAPLISTIGFSIFLENLALNMFGADSRAFPVSFSKINFDLGFIHISLVQIVILAIAVGLMLVLRFWIDKTKMGKALRATAENKDTAGLLGINTNAVIVITVMIASGLGGIAGVLVGMAYNAVSPTMGLTMGFKGLAVLILGGVGNITGAMIGGLVLGMAEILSVAYGDSSYRDAVAFGIIILILFLRPQGLFGRSK